MYVNRRLLDAITNTEPVGGLTHAFYRYPARFSPLFVRAAIENFSKPGDVILDPFMGSGTTMVEARALGRNAVGSDINSLAIFLAKTKTARFQASDVSQVREWALELPARLDLSANEHARSLFLNGMQGRDTWRLRKAIQFCLDSLERFDTERTKNLARCIILRAAQWALDCRSVLPNVSEFKERILLTSEEMLCGATEFSKAVRNRRTEGYSTRATCIQCSASELHEHPIWKKTKAPKLVLTSPPYPGVHVLYHRWQIRGRQETSVPYWISGTVDGSGASFYTFGDRSQKDFSTYFRLVRETFSSIAAVCDKRSLIVQMVAFSDPQDQLPRYLAAMNAAGLQEVRVSTSLHRCGERIWRQVPNRKWYAEQKSEIGSASEVVLFHRKR